MSGIKSILITTTAVFGLLLIWTLLTAEPDKTAEISAQQKISHRQINNRIESLEAELSHQKATGLQLEIQLNELEQQLINVQALRHKNSDIQPEPDKKQHKSTQALSKPATLQEKLISANIPLDTIQQIQQRIGKNRLAKLQLRDQAIREDWIDSPEYIEKEQQLPGPTEGLREEFGDQLYDQYLYASGRPNRVLVREIFSGSAAEIAGIQPRDIIFSYASDSIYTMSELQQATTEGISGEQVLIEILRDDIAFSTSVPRGPLGISMTISRIEPE